MLSYLPRYYPIWQELKQFSQSRPAGEVGKQYKPVVLEVGSGAEGLALFWKGPLVGVDVRFKRWPMAQGVAGSALRLPFAEASFPLVISCDMLEHLPGEMRQAAVLEMIRVCGESLLLAFPSGAAAWGMYQRLAKKWDQVLPPWLEEHLVFGLPASEDVADWLQQAGWKVETLWYESAAEHFRRILWERAGLQRWISYLAARAFGPWLIRREQNRAPVDPLRVLIHARRPKDMVICQ